MKKFCLKRYNHLVDDLYILKISMIVSDYTYILFFKKKKKETVLLTFFKKVKW